MFRLDIDDRDSDLYMQFDGLGGKRKVDIRKVRLTTADGVAWFQDLIKFCVERKTWNDMAASIKDGRIDQQLDNMRKLREETGCAVILIVEGTPRKEHGHIDLDAIISKLDHIIFNNQAHVMFTRDISHTAERMLQLIDHMHVDLTYIGGKDKSDKEDLLTQMHEIGPEEQSMQLFSAVKGISRNTARVFIKQRWSVLDLYNCDVCEPISELVFESGNKFGTTRARGIIETMGTKKCWIDILKKINGVTKITAEKIMQDFNDPNEWTVARLAGIQKSEKRKLGTAVAKKIIAGITFVL